jgi:putative transposase
VVSPQSKRECVEYLTQKRRLSVKRACALVGFNESSFYYKHYSNRSDSVIEQRMIYHSQVRIRWGFLRLVVLLRREGIMDNKKRLHRIYTKNNLQLQKRFKKKKRVQLRLVLPQPTRPNQIWSMDFVSDALFDGRRFRCFTLVDEFTHECLAIEVDRSLPAEKVVTTLMKVKQERVLPEMIVCDNGPEFISQRLDVWSYQNKVQLKFIQPGKPVQNAYIESFNGKFRDESLNQHWFTSLDHAKQEIEAWRNDYNFNRPHRSLKMKTPNEFAKEYQMMLTS